MARCNTFLWALISRSFYNNELWYCGFGFESFSIIRFNQTLFLFGLIFCVTLYTLSFLSMKVVSYQNGETFVNFGFLHFGMNIEVFSLLPLDCSIQQWHWLL